MRSKYVGVTVYLLTIRRPLKSHGVECISYDLQREVEVILK